MYLKYYGLKNRPFQINTDSAMLWLGEKHKEALATLKYGVYENKGFLLLTGDIGTGKTTLINALIGNLGKDVICSTISNPGMEKLDFLNYIAHAFNIKKKFKSKGEFVIYFNHFLRKARENKKRVLLIVDESQKLTQELLDEIRLLSNIEIPNSKLINIFFIGQNEFNDILNKKENEAVVQRITINYNLQPLTKKETYEYIRYRLKISGSQNQIFKKEAIEEIYYASNGIPRKINILCDHALLTGYVKGKKKIDKKIVKECADEIDIKVTQKNSVDIADKNIQPKKRRSFAKTAVYLSIFLIAWSTFGFFYYSNDGHSFDSVGDYWAQGIMGIKNKIFTRVPALKNDIEINETQAAQNKTIEIKDDSDHTATKSQEGILVDKNKKTAEVIEIKRTQEIDLQNNLSKFSEVAEAKNFDLSTALDNKDTHHIHAIQKPADKQNTDKTSMIVKNAALIENDHTAQTELSGTKDRNVIASEKNIDLKVKEDDEIIENRKFTINFDYNSNLLNGDGTQIIHDIVEIMQNHPKASVIVKGHTDNAGNNESNLILSQKRANIVKQYLLQEGIHDHRIKTIALGDKEPIASNDSIIGRRSNRRVEIEITNKG